MMKIGSAECQVIAPNSGRCICLWSNVVITIWNDAPDMSSIRKIEQVRRHLKRRYPQGTVGLNICMEGMLLPSPKVRKDIGEVVRRNHETVTENVVVLQGAGFWASSVRAFFSSFTMLLNKETHKLFDDLSEALLYLKPHFADKAGTTQEIISFVHGLQNDMALERRVSSEIALDEV